MAEISEPPFISETELFSPPFHGRHMHYESELRCIWSLLWSKFHDRRLCHGFMMYNRMFSLDLWREAIARSKVGNIKYISAIASTLQAKGF